MAVQTTPRHAAWSLEIVRGRTVGRRFPLAPTPLVLGNALGGEAGIDLSAEETSPTRRMTGRHAILEWTDGAPTIRDLDSPVGTFINRRRILPGTAQALQPGDVIELAAVQLRVVSENGRPADPPTKPAPAAPRAANPPAPAPSTTAAPGSLSVRLPSGVVCRSWDDLLRTSVQRWAELRGELISGRLAGQLIAQGQGAFAPDPNAPGSPDERLDAWLGRLPTSRPFRPELDVHPSTLKVSLSPGGSTRVNLLVNNVGHRLMHTTVRIEPAGTGIEPAVTSMTTLETTDLSITVRRPEVAGTPPTVVLEGDGGSRRIPITFESPAANAAMPDAETAPAPIDTASLLDAAAPWFRLPLAAQLAIGAGAMVAIRLLMAAASLGPNGAEAQTSGLIGPAVVFAVAGAVAFVVYALRRRSLTDVPAAAFSGAIAGVIKAALCVALIGAVEGVPGLSLTLAVPLWAAVGAAVAAASRLFAPPREVRA